MYFSEYKNKIKSDIEEAYNILDEEYRLKRFGGLNEFKTYVKENQNNIEKADIIKYQKYEEEDITRYICIDNNENYYIIYETNPMQYTIMLDTYTLDTPEFIEKYNSTNEQGKVALNIQKIIQAINNKDYKYVYNCLSEGFKRNYFRTQDDLKKYIQGNFFEFNEPEYENFSETSGIYKYEVKIKNKNDSEESIIKTFVIKLNSGTDFEISFNV